MNKLEFPETTKWVVAHNNEDIFQAFAVDPVHCLQTGQPYLETFDTAEEAITSFPQLSTDFFNLSAIKLGVIVLPQQEPTLPEPVNEPAFEVLPPG